MNEKKVKKTEKQQKKVKARLKGERNPNSGFGKEESLWQAANFR